MGKTKKDGTRKKKSAKNTRTESKVLLVLPEASHMQKAQKVAVEILSRRTTVSNGSWSGRPDQFFKRFPMEAI